MKVDEKKGPAPASAATTMTATNANANPVSKLYTYCRLFCLGIGNQVDKVLLKKISGAGNGTYMVSINTEKLRDAVAILLKNSLQPTILNPKLQWLGNDDKPLNCVTAPTTIAPIFREAGMLAFAMFEDVKQTDLAKMGKVVLTGQMHNGQEIRFDVPLSLSGAIKHCGIRNLAGKCVIREFEDGHHPLAVALKKEETELTLKQIKRYGSAEEQKASKIVHDEQQKKYDAIEAQYIAAVVEKSLEYGVMCQQTSFVLVDPAKPEVILDVVSAEVPVQSSSNSNVAYIGAMYAMPAAAACAPASSGNWRSKGLSASVTSVPKSGNWGAKGVSADMDEMGDVEDGSADDDSDMAYAMPAGVAAMSSAPSNYQDESLKMQVSIPKPVLPEFEQLVLAQEFDGSFTYDKIAAILKVQYPKFAEKYGEFTKKFSDKTINSVHFASAFMVQYFRKKYPNEMMGTHQLTMEKLEEWITDTITSASFKKMVEVEAQVFVASL